MKQLSFPPEVLARILPEISLERHLALGIRPSLRNFTEFKPVSIAPSDVVRGDNIVAANVARSGNTTLITSIGVAVVEKTLDNASDYGNVWPIVEIQRGRIGEPTDEEMIIAQQLHETIYHSKVIPKGALDVQIGQQVGDEVFYEENDVIPLPKKKYEYVLQVHVLVLSRSGLTSAIFDLIHRSVLEALHSMKLPSIYMEEQTQILMGGRVTLRNKRGFVAQETKLCLDHNRTVDLKIADGGISSNFGVVDQGLLADLEGDAEELGVLSRVLVIADKNGRLKRVSLVNGDNKIGLEQLKEAIEIGKMRAAQAEA